MNVATRWLLLQGAGGAVTAFSLSASVVAGPQVNLTWEAESISGETGYSIQRRDVTAAGAFAEIDTVGPGVEAYTGDTGPFTANHRYAYKVVVVGGPQADEETNEVAVFGGTSISRRLRRYGY